jgi:tetratricopeptide (TPR) repeat protein
MALAQAAHDEGKMNEALGHLQKAADLWSACGETLAVARALHGLGNASRRQDMEAAERHFCESLKLAEELGDDPLRALNLTTLGLVASRQGRGEEAEERLSAAIRLFRQWDDPWGLAIALNSRAQNHERLGQLLAARDVYQESLEIKHELEDRRGTAITLLALARLAPRLGEPAAALGLLMESLALNRELGDTWGCAVVLGSLAEHRLAEGSVEPALELGAAAREALDSLGGGGGAEAAQLDAFLSAARTQLPTERADAALRRGRESSLTRICDNVLARGAQDPSG